MTYTAGSVVPDPTYGALATGKREVRAYRLDTGAIHPTVVNADASGRFSFTDLVDGVGYLAVAAVRPREHVGVPLGQQSGYLGTGLFADGTAAAPSIAFAADTNTGIYREAEDVIGFAAGGVKRMTVTTTAVNADVPFRAGSGTVGAPSFSFHTDADTGFYRVSSGTVGLSSDNAYALSMGAFGISTTVGKFFAAFGDAAGPAYTFADDNNTGMYQDGADTLSFSTGGVKRMTIDSSGQAAIAATPGSGIALRLGTIGSGSGAFFSMQASGTGGKDWWLASTNNTNGLGGGYLGFYDGSAYRATLEGNADYSQWILRSGSVQTSIGAYTTGSYGWLGTQSNHSLYLRTNATNKVQIDAGGMVYFLPTNAYLRIGASAYIDITHGTSGNRNGAYITHRGYFDSTNWVNETTLHASLVYLASTGDGGQAGGLYYGAGVTANSYADFRPSLVWWNNGSIALYSAASTSASSLAINTAGVVYTGGVGPPGGPAYGDLMLIRNASSGTAALFLGASGSVYIYYSGSGTNTMYFQIVGAQGYLNTAGWQFSSNEFHADGSRRKERIALVTPAEGLAWTRAIAPRVYGLVEDPDAGPLLGFFAEELRAVSPLLSNGKMVGVQPLQTALVAAVQNIDARLTALEERYG